MKKQTVPQNKKHQPTPNIEPKTADPTANAQFAEKLSKIITDPKSLIKDTVSGGLKLFFTNPMALAKIFVILFALAAAARLVGYDVLFFVPVWKPLGVSIQHLPVIDQASWVQQMSQQAGCIAEAKSLGKPYVLQHVTQYLDYEDDPGSPGIRTVHEKIIYTILPLRNISEEEQVFLEEYSNTALTDHWYGPRREVPIGGNSKYQVVFDGKVGDSISLLTGAEFRYKLPLQQNRLAFRGKVTVSDQEDFWSYQNIDDVICELDQVIDSRTLSLSPKGRGSYRTDGKLLTEGDATYQAQTYAPAHNTSIQAHWSFINPGEDAGTVFRIGTQIQ